MKAEEDSDYAKRRLDEFHKWADRVQRRQRALDERRIQSLSRPFLDDTLMQGPPSCKIADFKRPRLRRCPFDLASISWEDAKVLGCGLDGFVWRVNFGDQGPFALKLVSRLSYIAKRHRHSS